LQLRAARPIHDFTAIRDALTLETRAMTRPCRELAQRRRWRQREHRSFERGELWFGRSREAHGRQLAAGASTDRHALRGAGLLRCIGGRQGVRELIAGRTLRVRGEGRELRERWRCCALARTCRRWVSARRG